METKEQQHGFGRYGDQRREYLQSRKPEQYKALAQSNTLEQHLAEREADANKWIVRSMREALCKMPCPDDAANIVGWLSALKEVLRGAEETAACLYVLGD